MRHASIRRILPLGLLLLLAAAGVVYLARQSGAEAGPLQASGTVASVEVVVAPEMTGRVAEVLVEEGQAVDQGDALFRLDDSLLRAQQDRLSAALETAEAAVRTAQAAQEAAQIQYQLALRAACLQDLPRRLAEWREALPTEFTLPSWYFSQEEQIAAAEAEIEAAEQSLHEEQTNFGQVVQDAGGTELQQAFTRLAQAQAGFVVAQAVLDRARLARQPQDLLDAAQALFDEAQEELDAAQSAYDEALQEETASEVLEARSRLAVAEARLETARDHLAQLQTGEYSLTVQAAQAAVRQAEAGLAQARAALAQTQAELEALQVQLDKLVVTAPVDGVVLTRSIEPGEVLLAGGTAMTLGQLDQLTITVYLPENRYGQVRLGDQAEVSVDSFPGETFMATVVHIASRAEFTPRNVQTEEGRRTTVFAVDLRVSDPEGKLKPGMPADVTFRLP
ncbi:MAG: efflux RND transporter periplasmic adaptor subunit [Chloroflexota bacterium]